VGCECDACGLGSDPVGSVDGDDGEHRTASHFVCTPENGTRSVTGCLRVQR
jgi:hypothetical protein